MPRLEAFDVQQLLGLSEQEAAQRLTQEGHNELPSTEKRGFGRILLEVLREPMFLLLIGCGGLYLILGELTEALLLLGFVFIIIGITFFQERRTERALEALRNLASPRALVVRDGVQKRIPARELVHEDVMLLAEGDRVPADAILLASEHMQVDESLLTGESVPVRKATWDGSQTIERPGGDGQPFVFSGTLVVKGHGIARVERIGSATEMGKIGKALQTVGTEQTNLQRQTKRIVRNFALVGLTACLAIVLVFGLSRSNWMEGLLAGITLAMAMLPEEFPVVLTIFLASGAWRISRHQVLTRRVPAVETLGSATVLCVDKTGTLTLNQMRVTHLAISNEMHAVGEGTSLPNHFHELVEYSILASPTDPFDPMEKAMKGLGEHALNQTEHLHKDWLLIREYPLSDELLAMSRVWAAPDGSGYLIASKGAPEAMADLCHLSDVQHADMELQIEVMANQGLRVIGVARAGFQPGNLPGEQHDFVFEFLGLLGLADPIRPEVPPAVAECYTAGVRVIMITGDYPGTAKNIARSIGLSYPEQIITGPELDRMSDEELQQRIRSVNVFARVVPEQKLRLVQALKANGEIVAMTGDGVNDAPALKSAHIGVAMGCRGTDVAREAASLVLLDDNFASIVQAVRLGRRIFDNLRKAMSFIVSVHIPIAGMSLLPVFLNWPLVLLPVHVVFLELIIDPACSVVFEAEKEELDVMHRPPRRVNAALFDRSTMLRSLTQGIFVLATTLGIFATFLPSQGDLVARAASFLTLVVGNLGLIFSSRTTSGSFLRAMKRPNPTLWWVCGGTSLLLVLSLTLPFLQSLFRFDLLPWNTAAIAVGAGLMTFLLMEVSKVFFFRTGAQEKAI